ncbi:MAG: SGNH/GDSL hydrolase family protein [Bryobacteraceae bacterium]
MRFTLVLLFASALSAGAVCSAQASDTEQTHWAGTWGASPSPQLSDVAQMSKAKLTFANQTLREIVHVSIGGSLVRVRLSNAYGQEAVEIGGAHIALRQKGAAITAGSDHVLTFSGRSSITIPPNALVLSDAIPLHIAPSSDLAISIFLPKSTLGAGIHYSAQQTNYLAAGDLTSAPDIPNPSTLGSWAFLTGVDVAGPEAASTLVAFGDSITDGARSTDDTNHRWPNFLAERLLRQTGAIPIGVLNEGIGGNRILHDPNSKIAFGVNALARFDHDVLAQPAVKYVIVLEGINDLGHAGPNLFPNEQVSAEDIIAGLKQLIERAHEKGIKIYGSTLTPFLGTPFPGYFSEAKEMRRKAVNQWIRTSRAFDAVIDFEKAVQDPANPDHMAPAFDSGDHLHPKDDGYKAMADCVDLSLFK